MASGGRRRADDAGGRVTWRPAWRWVPALLVVVVLGTTVSCGGGPFVPAQPGQRPQTKGPTPGNEPDGGRPATLDPAGGLLLGTPVYDGDFADPYVLAAGGRYYAYATNTTSANVPLIVSNGGNRGQYFGDAFPTLPSWSTPGFVWAPAVYAVGGRYVLYYTTRVTSAGRQCVSRAVADAPTGPFVDDSTGPMVCQLDLGGTIDPSVVTDVDGSAWLLVKNDGNCCKLPTSLWSLRLSADGLGVVGEPSRLLGADQPWEGGLIEGPSMVIQGGEYYLFYSANAWDTADYAIGWARCSSMTGPCTKPDDGPWMTSTPFARGPGGQEFYGAVGQVWMVYHGWEPRQVGPPEGQRRLYLDIVRIEGGRPVRVGAPSAWFVVLTVAGMIVFLGALAVFFLQRHRRRRAALAAAVSRH